MNFLTAASKTLARFIKPTLSKVDFINHELGLPLSKARKEAEKVSIFIPKGKGETLFVKRLSSGRFISYDCKKNITVYASLQDVWEKLAANYTFCFEQFPCI